MSGGLVELPLGGLRFGTAVLLVRRRRHQHDRGASRGQWLEQVEFFVSVVDQPILRARRWMAPMPPGAIDRGFSAFS